MVVIISTLSTQDISTMHILTSLSPSPLTEFLWHYIYKQRNLSIASHWMTAGYEMVCSIYK